MRAARAALFAVVCVGVGATLHTAADGCHVSSLGIALGLLGASALGYAGLGRERNGPTLTQVPVEAVDTTTVSPGRGRPTAVNAK